jgi:TrpR-related protein YerC/YecD
MTGGGDWRSDQTSTLFEAILALETSDEAARFFRDLCTLRELEEMSQRWHIARLLEQGLPYREISEQTGSSTATVTRISQWLRHGEGGYRLVLDRLGLGSGA